MYHPRLVVKVQNVSWNVLVTQLDPNRRTSEWTSVDTQETLVLDGRDPLGKQKEVSHGLRKQKQRRSRVVSDIHNEHSPERSEKNSKRIKMDGRKPN